jgi:glycine dehydrogenase subunit 2
MLEEPLIFEIGARDVTGVDLPEPSAEAIAAASAASRPRAPRRSAFPACPSPRRCATTPASVRQNYAIDLGLFPLGSCTMKHNPRLNEKIARLPGFADIHPLQPQETVQGALEVINELATGCST